MLEDDAVEQGLMQVGEVECVDVHCIVCIDERLDVVEVVEYV